MTTATPSAPTEAVATGVTIVAAAAMSRERVAALVREVATLAGAERVWDADDDALGTLAFSLGAEAALAIVRAVPPEVASNRPDLVRLLEAPVRDALRVEVLLRRDEHGAFARADAALVMLADRLGAAFGGIVVDDLGCAYDPAELARLAADKSPRALAFSYALGAARRAVADAPLDVVPPPVPPDTSAREAPRDPSPDGATSERVVFRALGPHLPLVTLARMTLALAGDARTNPHGRGVTLVAPAIAAAEGLRLAALGVDLRVSAAAIGASSLEAGERRADGAGGVREGAVDEIHVFTRDLSTAGAIEVVETFARELVAARVAGERHALPEVVSIGEVRSLTSSGFPHRIASFNVAGVSVDAYVLELEQADAIFATFVRARSDLGLLLGGDARAVVAIETRQTHRSSERSSDALAAADVVATALASAFVARASGVAADAIGAVYGPDELRDLARAGSGRARSWSTRVAAAMLDTSPS